MKAKFYLIFLIITSLSYAQGSPDFQKIFKEIKNAKSVTKAIEVRKNYVQQMQNLNDFDRLSDLEMLGEGEFFFEHYKNELSKFVLDNVSSFMLDRQSDEEQGLYARSIVKKGHSMENKFNLASQGLFFYVQNCQDYKNYLKMVGYISSFQNQYQHLYCKKIGRCFHNNFSNSFQLISNIELKNGEYKIIYLPSDLPVSKLVFSLSSHNKINAYFDVMVNNEIKGTVYGRTGGPSYVINVKDYADHLTLHSFYGNAYIHSIKVIIDEEDEWY